ncbi:NAD-P-binding protein [Trametes coccinea BRFM310]|uniref:NAD-P-binding protein n=1 Tax=Trametes coccinea (strain BRFM310) TaxID=1353009 RepID=A0A1Y2I9L9_TRAC3|nr:NAD-P-binding protein [Trametes coccinea BRFM310]
MLPPSPQVTGINGFLGAHIVDQLVKANYRVRGTVRSARLDFVRQSNTIYGSDVEVIAADDLAFGDFTDALKGVDGVIHAAAPLIGKESPEQALTTSIEGALNILRQAEKAGIKRFVLVSSLLTVKTIGDPAPVYTDEDWVETTREKALASNDPTFVYVSEKVLAERAVWEFAEKHPNIDVTSVNPPFFLGPFAPNFRFTEGRIGEMSTNVLAYTLLNPTGKPFVPLMLTIDVRDVARATVKGLTSPLTAEVGRRKRLLFLPHVVSWKDCATHIAQERPELRDRVSKPALNGEFPDAPPRGPVDNSRAVEVLKLGQLNDWKTTLLAAVDSIVKAEKNLAKEGKSFH